MAPGLPTFRSEAAFPFSVGLTRPQLFTRLSPAFVPATPVPDNACRRLLNAAVKSTGRAVRLGVPLTHRLATSWWPAGAPRRCSPASKHMHSVRIAVLPSPLLTAPVSYACGRHCPSWSSPALRLRAKPHWRPERLRYHNPTEGQSPRTSIPDRRPYSAIRSHELSLLLLPLRGCPSASLVELPIRKFSPNGGSHVGSAEGPRGPRPGCDTGIGDETAADHLK